MLKKCITKLSVIIIFVVISLINFAYAQDASTWMPDANFRAAVRETLELADNEVLTQAKMLNLKSLSAPKLEISSISGLEYATNLKSLSIWNNQINDISPLTDLTNLTDLYIGGNQISDISPLANLVNLKRLGMLRNQITDISVLAGLVNLESLKLANNPITNTSSVVNLPKLSDVDIEIPSIIPDANLRKAIRTTLDVEENLRITPNAMKKLSTLSAPKLEISSISGLEYATNLKSLSIWNNQISDISPLTDLTSLTDLYIGGNQISDISPLANLVNLKRLGMLRNQITDISALAGLVNLESLKLAENPIMDTSVLANLPKLIDLDIEISKSPEEDDKPPKDETPQVVPNRAPVTVGTISGRTLTVAGASVSVDVSDNFQDPDNDSLSYSVVSNNMDVVTINVAGAEVTLTPHGAGNAIITVTASDGKLTATQTILVTVTAAPIANRAPVTVGAISPRTLTAGSASVVVDVSANFSDPDSDSLSYSASSDNTDIATVSVAGAEVTLTPHSAGSAVVTITASDGKLTATQTILVTVTAAPIANRAPVTVGAISPRTLTVAGASVRVDVSDNFQDPDNDNLSYSVGSDNTGIVSVSVSNSLVTLTPVGAGNAIVTVTASDGKLTATQTISISVVVPNRAPVTVGAISPRTLTAAGASVRVDVSDNFQDPDNDDLSYSVGSDNTDIATVSVSDALVTLTPVGAGSATVTVTASDSKLTATQTISVIVTAAPVANRAPVTVGAISARTLTVDGASAEVNVSANFSDPDDDTLTYTASSDATSVATVSVSGALVTITPEGIGNATITVTVSDGKLTAMQTISVSVVVPNRAPVAIGEISPRTLISEGTSEQVDVSSNFRDPDDDTLTYTASSDDTSVATVSVSGALVTITPKGAGDATITVTVSDGKLTAKQTISVSVTAPNRAPVAVGTISSYTLMAGGSVVRVDVSSNFSDPDDDNLTYTASSDDTSVATVSVSGALVTITPEGTGDATITVTASDGELTTKQTISVSVAAPNRAPVAVGMISDYTLIAEGSVVRVDVSSNFSDPDDDTLTYTASSDNTSVATVSVSGALVTIAPEGAGDASITVTASDSELTATQNISVSVAAPNRAPVAVGTIPSQTLTAEDSSVQIDVSSNFSDPDDDTLTYTTSSDNTSVATVSVAGSLVTITSVGTGNTTITVAASDGELTATQTISVSVDVGKPGVSITGPSGVENDEFDVTITFTEPVSDFEQSDIDFTGTADVTITEWSANTEKTVFTAKLKPTKSGKMVLKVPEGVAKDAANNPNTASAEQQIEIDITQPDVSFSFDLEEQFVTPISYITNGPFTMTITFTEPVSGFEQSDLEPDEDYTFTDFEAVDTKTYTVKVTPDPGDSYHNLGFHIEAGVATDAAGNPNTAANSPRVAVETHRPNVEISVPDSDVVTTTFTIEIKFDGGDARDDRPLGFDQSDLSLTNNTAGATITTWTEKQKGFRSSTHGSFQGSYGAFEAEITVTQSGSVTFGVSENAATDLAGNGNTAATQKTVTVTLPGSDPPEPPETDTTPPSISFSFDLEEQFVTPISYIANGPFVMTITFTEPVSGFEQSDLTLDEDYTFTDFKVIDAETIDTVAYADTYTVKVIPDPGDSYHNLGFHIGASVATDAAGNPNTAANSPRVAVETHRPNVEISVPDSDVTTTTFTIEIKFDGGDARDDRPLGFDQSDLSLTNNTAGATITTWTEKQRGFRSSTHGSFQGGYGAFEAEITVTQSGSVTFGVPENAATDLAGNGNTAAFQKTVTVALPGSDPPETPERDTTSPSISFSFDLEEQFVTPISYIANGPFVMTITFTEPVSGFEQSDLTLDEDYTFADFKTIDAETIDTVAYADSYTVKVIPDPGDSYHNLSFHIEAGVVTDAAGNPNTAANSPRVTVETHRPNVEISVPDSDVTTTTFTIEIKFDGGDARDDRPLGFEQSDLSLTNNTAGATITTWTEKQRNFQGSDGVFSGGYGAFEAEITVTQSGQVTFGVSENAATDLAGNGNTAAVQKTVTVTLANNQGSAPLVSVSKAGFVLDPTVLKTLDRDALLDQLKILRAKSNGSPKYLRTIRLIESILATMRPSKTQLLANYPNPFNPETWIPYHLANPSNVQITIYNARGTVVRRLELGHQQSGYYISRSRAAYWDGTNSVGERVASGIYFYQLEADNASFLRKMVILK